jgi:hypothetical protein
MNLRGIANSATRAINPNIAATVLKSDGYDTRPDGGRVPKTTPMDITAQVQSLTYNDLVKLDGQNIQGVRRAIFTNGYVAATIRVDKAGGDLIKFPAGTLVEGDTWLCAMVLETWPDWCKIAITLQVQ